MNATLVYWQMLFWQLMTVVTVLQVMDLSNLMEHNGQKDPVQIVYAWMESQNAMT